MPSPIKASTQEHLNIEDVQDGLVILKNGSCSLILQITAINFGLLSEAEQDAIIYAYAGLLNSLTFPTQIVIRSKRKDISSYLALISEQEKKIKKPALQEQLKKYRAFVEETVKKNEVLDKKFYISIPFSTLELGVASTLTQTLKPKKGLPYPKSYILEKAKTNLFPKRDHLVRQFNRLGLKNKQLNTQETLELFYNIYNPESVGQTFVTTKDYKTSLVSPAIAGTKPRQTGTKPEEREKSMDLSNQTQTPKPAAPTPGGIPPRPAATPAGQTTPSPGQPAKPTAPVGPTAPTPPIIKSDEGSPAPSPAPASPAGTTGQPQAEINKAAQEVGQTSPAASPTPPAGPTQPPATPAETGTTPPSAPGETVGTND